MFDVKKILCPTDFSDQSKQAIQVAVSLAEKFGIHRDAEARPVLLA